MRYLHVAALALLGWYVIMPPASSPDPNVPLSQWKIVKKFESELECKEQEEFWHLYAKQPPNNYDWARNPRSYAQCVASDDPRLKSN